jgi:hypothetical protein
MCSSGLHRARSGDQGSELAASDIEIDIDFQFQSD